MRRVDIEGISILSAPIPVDGKINRQERERRVVKELLHEFFDAETEVYHHDNGAPYLAHNEFNISISHSCVRAVVALSKQEGIGIDTETLRPQLERVKDKYLSEEERQRYTGLSDMLWAWSAKEAVYKATMKPGLSLKDGIKIKSERLATVGSERFRLTTVEKTGDAVTVLAVRQTPVGRFAPSPTGRMHLGNIFTAIMSYLSVKSRGGRWILRLEDLDPQRSKVEYSRLIEDDLHWLGLEWDEGGLDDRGPNGPYSQSRRHDIYEAYLNKLMATGLTYPCSCTRADIMATQAPHQSDGRVIYSGRCRPPLMPCFTPEPPTPHATRLWVPSREIVFTDRHYGEQKSNLATDCGDFILRRADGAWAYQLAVVVDDALMGVTEVVRGADLMLSSAQQIYLYELLGFETPEWVHVPLVTTDEGRRLSKRDRSMGMEELRCRYTPEELMEKVKQITDFATDKLSTGILMS